MFTPRSMLASRIDGGDGVRDALSRGQPISPIALFGDRAPFLVSRLTRNDRPERLARRPAPPPPSR